MTIINCDKIVLKVDYIFQTVIKIILTYVRGFVVFIGWVIIKIFKDVKNIILLYNNYRIFFSVKGFNI